MIHERQIKRKNNQTQSQLLDYSNIALQNFVNSIKAEKTKSII